MTQDDLLALIEIINRAPVTTAERLWLIGVLNQLQAEILHKANSLKKGGEGGDKID